MTNATDNNTSSTTNMSPSSDQKYSRSKPADPETSSIATFSSTAPLVKKDDKKQKEAAIDAKKLQEQALKSQIRFSM